MSNSKKWENDNYVDYIDDSQLNNQNVEIETNILIREEAQYLAKNLFNKKNIEELSNKMKDSYESTPKNLSKKEIEELNLNLDTNNYLLSKIEDKLNKYKNLDEKEQEIKTVYDIEDENNSSNLSNQPTNDTGNQDELNDIKNTLIQNNLNLEKTFSSFECFMNNALDKMDAILNGKKDSTEISQDSAVKQIDQIDWDAIEVIEPDTIESRIESVNHIQEQQNDFALKQEELSKQLNILKENIQHLTDINELQATSLQEKHALDIFEVQNEINLFKDKYEDLNKEINKIYSIWTENNNLLNNLENLLVQLNQKNDELIVDRQSYIEELHNKSINNEKYINELLIQNEDLKIQFSNVSQQISDIGEFRTDLLNTVDEKIANNNNLIQEQINSEIDNIKSQMKDISLETVESELAKRNLTSLEEIINQERIVDTVLSSNVFNLALESKLNNIINSDQNLNFIKNTFSNFDSYKNQIIDQVVESDRIRNIVSIESNNLINSLKMDVTEKLNDAKEYMYQKNFALNERVVDLEHRINNIGLDEKEIYDMISSSKEIENIINDKLIFIINEKLNSIQDDISFINRKLEEDLKHYVDNNLKNKVITEVVNSDKMKYIKNEALQSVYSELVKRDERISLQSEEILKNYETLLENNRILENLEKLVIKQVEEVDGFKKDKEDSIDLIMEKISDQKSSIIDLQNKIEDVINENQKVELSSSELEDLDNIDRDVYENIKLMTLNLVKEEIKKLNLINKNNNTKENQQTKENGNNDVEESESDFFKNRIQDILSKLNQSYEPLNAKKDLVDLNIKMNDLKDSDKENKDEDFSWFYEQELKNHKEEKMNIARQIGEKDNEIKFSYEGIDYEGLRNSDENDYIHHNDFNRRK